MEAEIKRNRYLNRLLARRGNGLVKIVTGLRRCGKSYLLSVLFKNRLIEEGVKPDHIIEMAFDSFENIRYRDPNVFYPWIKERIKDDGRYYILLDEIQLLDEFVSVLNGLSAKRNCDIYVTGSNARFLSKDILTEFGGRSDEVRMHPLSFSEFLSVYPGDRLDAFGDYMTYGGIPMVALAETPEQKSAILDNLLAETYIRDIKLRNKLRNQSEMESLLSILASSIGSLTNPNKLRDAFHSLTHSRITPTTIAKYIGYLEDSFLIEEAKRFDIKGKAYIGTPQKYYFDDLGLRNARIAYRQDDFGHAMENIIYNELRSRGCKVDVGDLTVSEADKNGRLVKKRLEVDFVCVKGSKKYYVQSAYILETARKTYQEIRPFLKIRDSFKKILITSNAPRPFYTEDGILVMSVFDFLKEEDSLDF